MTPSGVLRSLTNNASTVAKAIGRPLRTSNTTSSYRTLSAARGWTFVAFIFVYLALIRYCSYAYYRDPTSAFFDPARGYERVYSVDRQAQADSFILDANQSSSSNTQSRDSKMCIGIATVGREGEQYVRSTVASLLDGLKNVERNEIYLNVLIAHTAPHVHPIYSEAWLPAVADKVLLYDVSQSQFADLLSWEKEKDYAKKAIFDYTYLMQKCHNTGAQWIAMIEDDTLAVAGWYPRALEALEKADDQHRNGEQGDWLYLRLFFTEEFLGWNSEEWPRYLAASMGIVGFTTFLLLLIRQAAFPQAITKPMIAITTLVYAPALIILYFLAGRLSMQPFRPGVYEMSNFGCCAQGLVYSNAMAPKVIARLSEMKEGFVDVLIEAWANEQNLVRWVVVPSLLQHIGGHSSKGDDFGGGSKYHRSVAEKIWNFGFELYDSTKVW